MPYFTYYSGESIDSRIVWDSATYITETQLQQQCEEYAQEGERQDQIYELQMQMHEQQMEEERQLIKDKERYPLFFLKEGIL